jgi:predicted Fe-Mo cluster-binding NifX family protein
MKIAITSSIDNIDGNLDTRFGRCKYFLIYDLDNDNYEFISNEQNLNAAQGAGIQSASLVANKKVDAVISGNFGPKAFDVLQRANIKMYISPSKSFKDVIDDYKNSKLTLIERANVQGHW